MNELNSLSKMYYIMDGSGNFYQLSPNGQLIVATGRESADTFSYVDANRKIGCGRKAKFYQTVEVDALMKHEQSDVRCSETEQERDQDEQSELNSEENVFDISQIDWKEYLEYFCEIMNDLDEYKTDLENRQYGFEQKLLDLMHYAELCEMDDNRRLEIMDQITEARQCRRDVKDELVRIDCFQQSLGSNSNMIKCKNSIRQIEKLATRVYCPRKSKELFVGATYLENRELPYWNKKQEAKVFGDNNGDSLYYEDDYHEENQKDQMDYQEEYQMEQERIDTVFDGKNNDWLSFAKMQKGFYDNVWQHMTNLEIDLRAIDTRIEEILTRIEDANFNVTQGYKVFKALKDLRNEKKEKMKELDALEILTECYDIRAMRDALDYSVQEMEQLYGIETPVVSESNETLPDETEENEMLQNKSVKDEIFQDETETIEVLAG